MWATLKDKKYWENSWKNLRKERKCWRWKKFHARLGAADTMDLNLHQTGILLISDKTNSVFAKAGMIWNHRFSDKMFVHPLRNLSKNQLVRFEWSTQYEMWFSALSSIPMQDFWVEKKRQQQSYCWYRVRSVGRCVLRLKSEPSRYCSLDVA